MKIYIDLIILLNFFIDFMILLTVSIILKRCAKVRRIILSSLFGSLTILTLFIDMNNLELFGLKIITSIIMILICFGFKNINYFLKNLLYFYTTSIMLGGFLYLIKNEISLYNKGLVFIDTGLELNCWFIVIFAPIILYIYIKQIKELKIVNSFRKKVDVYINDKIIDLNGYVDSGNTLIEPYGNKCVIIVKNKKIEKEVKLNNYLLVPYKALNHSGVIKCIIPQKVYIEGIGIKENVVIGISEEKIKIDGVDCLLNILLMEGK